MHAAQIAIDRRAGVRTVMPLLITALTLLAVALIFFCIEPLTILPLLERLTPNLTYRIRTRHPLVALSFDDGPHPIFTPQVLDILRQHNAQATFFLIGERALRHPELVARIKAAGHEVANHYFTDGSLLLHSDADFVRNLERTEQVLGLTAGPKFFRPPGGIAWPNQLRLAQAHGYECMLGSAYPHDPLHPPVWYIRWLVTKNLAPGTIVILHDGIANPARTMQALLQILEAARRKGLSFVSIGTLKAAANQSHTT
jgi:peptidoglycan/xylan/chitin deacetylase (PgdA/CDA1 family)